MPLSVICTPPSGADRETKLHRSYFEVNRSDYTQDEVDPGGIEFNLPISGWLKLFRETGFEVLDYLELQAPTGSADRYGVPGKWAESWPAEQVQQRIRVVHAHDAKDRAVLLDLRSVVNHVVHHPECGDGPE